MEYCSDISEKGVFLQKRTVLSNGVLLNRNFLVKFLDGYRLLSSGDIVLDVVNFPGQSLPKYPQSNYAKWFNQELLDDFTKGTDGVRLNEAQLVLVFGQLGFGNLWNKENDLYLKDEGYRCLQMFPDFDISVLSLVSTELLGSPALGPAQRLLCNNSCVSAMIIPNIDGVHVKAFALSTAELTTKRKWKTLMGFSADIEKSLKGIVVVQRSIVNCVNSRFVVFLHEYLKTKPDVVVAGVTVPLAFSSNNGSADVFGFCLFGDDNHLNVVCKIIKAKQSSTLFCRQLNELKKNTFQGFTSQNTCQSVAVVFGPNGMTSDVSNLIGKYFPTTQLIGCTGAGQLGKELTKRKEPFPDFIEFDDSVVVLVFAFNS